jgi:uncharacterized protein
VLVARNKSALETLADECQQRFSTPVVILVQDLSETNAAEVIFTALRDRGVEVDVLVNNAGFGVHGPFLTTSLSEELALVQVQISSVLALCKRFLPGMVKRRRGGILNVASVYSFSPVPKQSVYSASKAFLRTFSESLAFETREANLQVTLLCPGVTYTEFRRRAGVKEKKSWLGMSAEEVARAGYRAFHDGRPLAIPGTINRIFVTVVRHLPAGIITRLMRAINTLRGVHQTALPTEQIEG